MNYTKTLPAFALFMILGACSSGAEVVSEQVEINEENLAPAATPTAELIGLNATDLELLAQVVADEYQDFGDIKLSQVGEPVSAVPGITEIIWDVTGFEDDSVLGERVIASVNEDSDLGVFEITNAIIQPICARGTSADGICL